VSIHFNEFTKLATNNFNSKISKLYMIRMKNSLLIVGTACVALALGSCNKDSSTPDTEEGNWVRRGQFDPAARTAAVSFVINDTAYVGTGYNKDLLDNPGTVVKGCMKDFWKFNIPATETGNYYWSQVATLPGDYRSQAVGFNVGNKGFVGTGLNSDGTYLKDFWEFNGSTWTSRADFPLTARIDAVGFGLNGKGYITTGYDGSTLKDIAAFDTLSKTWTSTGIPTLGGDKRRGAIAMVYANKAYIVTGYSSSAPTYDMFAFNGTNWEEKERIQNVKDDSFDDDYTDINREYGVGFVIGDYGYISTGDNGSANTKTWRYDVKADRWTRRTAYESTRSSRSRAVGFTVKGRGFVGLGQSGSSFFLENFDEFKPNETYNAND
jgi:N-acetylneuraminic acid mutarotase